jgi:hypothetical protein
VVTVIDEFPLEEGRVSPAQKFKKRIGKSPDALTGQRPEEISKP